jgi:hypothetical protein
VRYVTRTAITLLASTSISTGASAQEERSDTLASRHHTYESPQNFTLEARYSPYTPDIDSDPALHGSAPYKAAFGSGPLVFVGAEFDWQALRIPHFGWFGPGLGAGYASAGGLAMFATEHNGTFISGETTTLQIFPFYGVAVLRADALWREVGVPLVPYVKAGIGYALWRASNTLGTSSFQGVSGTGYSLGTVLAAGVGFNLNVFDRYAAQNFDDAMGVNATYLFAEITWQDLTGLGVQTDPLRVGGTNWTFGLSLDF